VRNTYITWKFLLEFNNSTYSATTTNMIILNSNNIRLVVD